MNVVADIDISGASKTKLLPISSHNDLGETSLHEECGISGAWASGEGVSKLTYYGLFVLQHRGQEAASIVVGDGDQILMFKDLGLASRVFDEQALDTLKGYVTVGHTCYTTTGAPAWKNAQPIFQMAFDGADVTLGHNGNLTNHLTLLHETMEKGLMRDEGELPSGSVIVTTLFADETGKIDHPEDYGCNTNVEAAVVVLLPRLKGVFCLTFIGGETLYITCSPYGARLLCLGHLFGGRVIASEAYTLDIVSASFVREIGPDEMVAIDASGVCSQHFAKTTHVGCTFEYVYLTHLDSNVRGHSVNVVRLELGRQLAREFPIGGDLAMPVPGPGTPVAVGYARESGIPFGQGLTKNGYTGRALIQPSQTIRQLGIRLKLNPLREVIAGKRLVVVDDSIIHGNTQRALIRMLHEAGAEEAHVRIIIPLVKWLCFYGIDFASPGELLVSGVDENGIVVGIVTAIGTDSLGLVSIDSVVTASEQAKTEVCCAYFDDKYPPGLPEGNPNATAAERMQAAQTAKVAASD